MTKQCKACPWKKSTRPAKDIPGGYCKRKHRALSSTIAEPGAVSVGGVLRAMACHESSPGAERMCIGWAAHQLGPGNNINLRLQAARDPTFPKLETVGAQHERFEDTLP